MSHKGQDGGEGEKEKDTGREELKGEGRSQIKLFFTGDSGQRSVKQ